MAYRYRRHSFSLGAFCFALILVIPASAQLETRAATPFQTVFETSTFATADFNHDGNLDLALVGAGVQIFLGNGDGTFLKPINYAIGSRPESIAVADFNGDGELDLAVANSFDSTIGILLGNGDGTFQEQTSISTPGAPVFLAAGDFNGDHKPDLVVIDGEYVTVFLNHGDGTFGAPVNTTKGAHVGLDAIAVGDFDSNGTLDLAIAANTLSQGFLFILSGNGDGTFTERASYIGSSHCLSVAVGDFRGSGRLDLAMTDYLGQNLSIFLGNGDGTFQPPALYLSPDSTSATVADFDGDGVADLIVSNADLIALGSVSVLLGNGDGTFQAQMVFPATKYPSFLGMGDFNGDQKLDVIDVDRLSGSMQTMLNTGTAIFSPTEPLIFAAQLNGTPSAPQTVTLTNGGTDEMTVSSVTVSSRRFQITGNTCHGTLVPGARCAISANFTPWEKGEITGTITIHDSASSKPQFVELVGVGTVIKVSPSSLQFAPQKTGTQSAPQTIELTNTGKSTLNFDRIEIGGSHYWAFTQSNDCGSQLAAGASCKITVVFSPFKAGPRKAFVELIDNGGGSPQRLILTGSGT